MSDGQASTVRTMLEFYAWAAEHPDRVAPVWREICEFVTLTATAGSVQRAQDCPIETEVLLYNITSLISARFPVS